MVALINIQNFSNMNRPTLLLFALLATLPLAATAQTDVALSPDYGGRVSVGFDKKIVKGLHLSLEEEIRIDNNFTSFNRFHTPAALHYKVLPYLKVGVGYALINPYSSNNNAFKNARHRLMFDATGTLKFGLWQLSLKERFQITHRTGDFNIYQNPANLMALKSRLTLKYKGLQRWTPYAYVELRNTLNAPVINALYNSTYNVYMTTTGSITGEAGWFLDGFSGCYVNRLRGSLGAEYKIDRRNSLNFYILLDHVSDKVVDANASGTKLKSYTREQGFAAHLGAAYEYSF